MVVDETQGMLRGIFTDSDLVRLLERGRDQMLDRPIGESMTVNPTKISSSATVAEAVDALRARKLSELPVVDDLGRPVGMIDDTDLIGLLPGDFEEELA
jgi:arabinose-5-phosphate isomerase